MIWWCATDEKWEDALEPARGECGSLTPRVPPQQPDGSAPTNLTCFALVVIDYQTRSDPEKLELFRSNDPSQFLGRFHIPSSALLEDEYQIDFCRMTAFPKSAYPYLLTHKKLEMDDMARIALKDKVALFFGNYTSEEEALLEAATMGPAEVPAPGTAAPELQRSPLAQGE
jgi:hypothetical protein